MSRCETKPGRAMLRIGGISLLLGTILAGCGQQHDPAGQSDQTAPAAGATATADSTAQAAPVDARMQQPFAEAAVTDPPPPDQQLPETTLAGKSVGKLYVEV